MELYLPLATNLRFVRFAMGKFLQLLAQNALVYGLFILLVQEGRSSLATSAFVLASVIPSIVLSLPGGVAADVLPAKLTILVTLALRAVIVGVFLLDQPTMITILFFSALLWSAYQFYTPGENVALPAVVPPGQIASASAILHGTSLLAQILGAGILAPIALKVFDTDGLLATVLAFQCTSLVFFAAVPNLTPLTRRKRAAGSRSFRALFRGLSTIRSDSLLARVTLIRVVVDTTTMMLVVSMPVIVLDILHTPAENTVYVVAPGALGIAAGLVVSPWLARIWVRGVLWASFVLVILVVLGLAFLPGLATVLDENTFVPLAWFRSTFGVSREIATMALLLPIGGFALTCIQITARTIVYGVAPPETIAQVFATQSAIGSVVALLPTILAGVLLDLFSVRLVLVMIEIALVACLLWLIVKAPRLDTHTHT